MPNREARRGRRRAADEAMTARVVARLAARNPDYALAPDGWLRSHAKRSMEGQFAALAIAREDAWAEFAPRLERVVAWLSSRLPWRGRP